MSYDTSDKGLTNPQMERWTKKRMTLYANIVQSFYIFGLNWSIILLATTAKFRYSFVCQGASTRRQRRDLFRSSSRAIAIPLSTLSKDTTSELAGLFSHYPFHRRVV